ncbi:unnamed protein product, partial [Rotaria magnacalcarata]
SLKTGPSSKMPYCPRCGSNDHAYLINDALRDDANLVILPDLRLLADDLRNNDDRYLGYIGDNTKFCLFQIAPFENVKRK